VRSSLLSGAILLPLCFCHTRPGHALELDAIYADGMVLQRDQPIVIRGRARPHAEVSVTLSNSQGSDEDAPSAMTSASDTGLWEVALPGRRPDDGSLTLTVTSEQRQQTCREIMVGDVWLCIGQSNMNFLMRPNPPWSDGVLDWEQEVRAANDGQLRFFTVVPEATHLPKDRVAGLWRTASSRFAGYLSAVPYYFGKGLREATGHPVGIIVCSLGGTSINGWSDPAALRGDPAADAASARHEYLRDSNAEAVRDYYDFTAARYRASATAQMAKPAHAAAYKEPYKGWRYQPSGLFNAMIHPLDSFPIEGILWYQGESDTRHSQTYGGKLTRMILGQRARRNRDVLPFVIVQLPNYDPVARGGDPTILHDSWARLREAQEEASSLPHTALVVTADVGDPLTIHPRDKKTVGTRAAGAASSLCDASQQAATGPILDSCRKEAGNVRLRFKATTGALVIDRTRATGKGPDFQIAGPDGVFHAAEANVTASEVLLSSPSVPDPVAVRYAFHNDPKLILYDRSGLPARPFRRTVKSPVIQGGLETPQGPRPGQ
jgi:sialate O-acetylesterase